VSVPALNYVTDAIRLMTMMNPVPADPKRCR
jgi:hypothetical protein